MFDLKNISLVIAQLEEEKGLPKDTVLSAIQDSLAGAYKKELGKRGQIIRAALDMNTGTVDYTQIKTVVSPDQVLEIEEGELMPDQMDIPEEERKIRFNPEQHLYVENARLIKSDVAVGEELIFSLEMPDGEFSRVATMTAKQVLMQKIRGAEKQYLSEKFGTKIGQIVSGTVERVEKGTVFVNMDKAEGLIQYSEQMRSERFKTGDRISAYLFAVEDSGRGVFLKLSRTHPEFIRRLFELEVPELTAGTIEIKRIAREPGSRSKVAVFATDPDIDPIGAMVGQSGSRISTVTSELSGERIDIVEWSADEIEFIESSLSPAAINHVEIDEDTGTARVETMEDQYSLAIGRGGQNVRLSAKLTGYKIDIVQIDSYGNEVPPSTPVPKAEPTETAEATDTDTPADTTTEVDTTDMDIPTESTESTDDVVAAEMAEDTTEDTAAESSDDETAAESTDEDSPTTEETVTEPTA